jgi:DNA-binding MarR family transcriptional regulator
MGPTSSLTYLLSHLAGVLSKQSDQILQEQLGIGIAQYKILMVLEWNPRTEQKAIADSLGQTEASISRQIKLLKSKNLLTTKLDPNNKRRHLSVPTPLGMQITEAANNILKRNFTSELSGYSEDRIIKLNSSLAELHKAVCKPGKLGACDHQLYL